MYRAEPSLVDTDNPTDVILLTENEEQKKVIWEWHGHGKKETRFPGTSTRAGLRVGEAYLVSEKR